MFSNISTEYWFNQKHLKSGAKSRKAVLLQTYHTVLKFLDTPLDLRG
jgi:hypothetical protein